MLLIVLFETVHIQSKTAKKTFAFFLLKIDFQSLVYPPTLGQTFDIWTLLFTSFPILIPFICFTEWTDGRVEAPMAQLACIVSGSDS